MKLVLLDASALEAVCMMIGRGMNVIDRGFCSVIARVVLANGPARRATSATLGKHARDLREKHATFADTDAAPKHSTSLRALSKARMDALFGKKTDFKDQVRSWKSDMRSEGRKCDKQIRGTCARRRPRSPLLPFPPPFPRPLADTFAPLPARSNFSSCPPRTCSLAQKSNASKRRSRSRSRRRRSVATPAQRRCWPRRSCGRGRR